MQPDHRPEPAKIIGELLDNHPEAASLMGHASHCRALVVCSALITRLRFGAAQSARLAYEELRHRLEPRGHHPVHFGVGLLLLFVLSAGLTMLDLIELGGLRSVLTALAATAVWVTLAWLGAVAVRRRRWSLAAGIGTAAVLLGLLMVALHGFGPRPGWPAFGARSTGAVVFGALLLVLTAGAACLVAHMEPASLFTARRRWYRARAAYEAAAEVNRADLEAAAVAAAAWLGLVRTRVTALAAGDERLVQATVALAAVLMEHGRPELPPSLYACRVDPS